MILAANLILCVSGTVAVQDYPSPMGVEHVRISRAQFQDHIDSLPLDAPRLEEARAAFAGYTGDFEELIKAFKLAYLWTDSVSALPYDASDDALWERIIDERDLLELNWQRSARELGEGYFDRLKLLAPPYEDVINGHRRDHLVKRSLGQLMEYVGETYFPNANALGLDLVTEARERGLGDWDNEIVAEYDARITPLAQRIDAYIWRHRYDRRQASRRFRAMIGTGERNDHLGAIEDYLDHVVAGVRLAIEVRRLNLEFAPRFASLLQPRERTRFEAVVDRALYPHAYAAMGRPIEERFNAALDGADLSEESLQALRELRDAVDAERNRQKATLSELFDRTIDPERYRRQMELSLRTTLFERQSDAWIAAVNRADVYRRDNQSAQKSYDEAVAAWRERLEQFDRQLRAMIGDAEDDE